MSARYPIRAVAKITGLSLDTLRAWERRYKAVVPQRSNRGRQYGTEDIDRLLLLHQLVQRGHAIGGIAGLPDAELKNLLTAKPGALTSKSEPASNLLDPVLAAIEIFDADRAGEELSRLAAVLTPRDLVYRVVLPLMREVGNRWHNGTFAIAQEHLTSQILRNLLGSMMRLFRKPVSGIKLVLATPTGESHEFGILASAMLAAMAGCEVLYLGADLPAHEIAAAAERVSARVTILGITIVTLSTEEEIRSIAAAMPEPCELWIGGAGAAQLDLSKLGRKTILLSDLPALESECHRWSKAA
jgi:MerR family transcriptional regulator, light-induced transcriptional regulator